MKKFIYILLFTVVSSLAFSACTAEEVTPSNVENGGGNTSSDGKY